MTLTTPTLRPGRGPSPRGGPSGDPPGPGTAPSPLPVAFLGRTSTIALQDPAAFLASAAPQGHRTKLPDGWYIAAHYWDLNRGLDLEAARPRFRVRGAERRDPP